MIGNIYFNIYIQTHINIYYIIVKTAVIIGKIYIFTINIPVTLISILSNLIMIS